MIRKMTFPVLASVSGPRTSMDRLEKVSVAGNNMSIAMRRLGAILFRVEGAQLATQSYKSPQRSAPLDWRQYPSLSCTGYLQT